MNADERGWVGNCLGVWTFEVGKQRKEMRAEKPREDVCAFVRNRLGIEADEQQRVVLSSEAKRGILNCSRQWGKSTISAAKAVHRAYTQANKLVLVASPSKRQSAEFVRKAAGMVRKLGLKAVGDGDNECSLVFPNGSRIVGLPGTEGTVRGFSAVSLIIIDEAARVDNSMYKALRPMLAVGNGDLWLMSTPLGRRGFFYENWAHGGDEWLRVSVPATECARIPKEFLEEERRQMGSAWFRQEYLCEFVDGEAGVFDWDLVRLALDGEVRGLDFRRG